MKTRKSMLGIVALMTSVASLPLIAQDSSEPYDEPITFCWPKDNGEYTGFKGVQRVDPQKAQQMRGSTPYNAVTLLDNGPSQSHIDLVFVGDGYTEDELDRYRNEVDFAIAKLFDAEPFKSYKSLFNIHRIDVVSTESGVDNDPIFGIEKDTALDMGFWCNGIARALCSDTLVTRAVAESYFEADQIIAIANSSTRGGAASIGQNIAHTSGSLTTMADVLIHELGHSLGRLADEYSTGGPANYPGIDPNEPNVTIFDLDDMMNQETKWSNWVGESFPGFDGLVGSWEGARYSRFGIYRPSINSRMRSSFRNFNMPSVEKLVIQFHGPSDGIASPTIFEFNEFEGHDTNIPVVYNHPTWQDLTVVWKLDLEPIGDASMNEFRACEYQLQPGRHLVTIAAVDETPWVRNQFQIEQLLTFHRHWWIDIETYPADANADGRLNYFDIVFFIDAFLNADPATDLAEPKGTFDIQDLLMFVDRLSDSCGL